MRVDETEHGPELAPRGPVRPPRAALLDLLIGVAVTAVVAVAITANLGGDRGRDIVAYLFAGWLGALMLLRRRAPTAVLLASAAGLVAYYVAGYPPVGLALPLAAALYSAAEAGRPRWAALVGLGLLVTSTAFRTAQGESVAYLFGFELASSAASMAAAVALGDGVRSRRLRRREQRWRLRQLEREHAREAARRVEEERLRIARDLHDAVAHHISVISLHAGVADEALDDDPPAARAALGHVRAATTQVARELRAVLGLLRDPTVAGPRQPVAGLAGLDALVAGTRATGLRVTVHRRGELTGLPAAVDSTAYRLVQEAVTNALRHSGATTIEIDVVRDSRTVALAVRDDGRGRPRDVPGGHGLGGMRERTALLGGTVTAGNRPGGGFEVRAELPLGGAP
ncbi:sensor histidine kinase [Micromonospora sp. CPCC 205561]|uniref:sensor histidine kinase n=1 Tax=Micromonospora sp. CPCC 205561 TaxID=3122407 RepID=UPI002FF42F4B